MKEHLLIFHLHLPLTLLSLDSPLSADYHEAIKSPISHASEDYVGQNLDEEGDYRADSEQVLPEMRSFIKQSDCEIKYETVSVVKEVPSFSKHCHKVQDTKCKTVFKNAFKTQMETQCVASFDTRSGYFLLYILLYLQFWQFQL